jgi:hypothetical protein
MSAGQFAVVPVQVSVGSHSPVVARQIVVGGRKLSAGQLGEIPLQSSSASHTPAPGRHTVPAFPAGCVHRAEEPSQVSFVQGFESLLQRVPAVTLASAGHVVVVPVQFSATSHSPAAPRQTIDEDAGLHVPMDPAMLHA